MDYLEKGRQRLYEMFSPPVKYHGLLNQGATCYLNSVLQVLFMTEDFRAAVKRHTTENPLTKCIDGHLTNLFDELKGYAVYASTITKELGIDKVYEQRDAAEYFEKILSLTSPEASQIFHGLLTHTTICSVCSKENDADGPFWHLSLALVDSYSGHYRVENGIEEYFRASDFSGENQMYCDQCDAKSDATVKCVMKHYPVVLMLLLKRFDFDYRYMTYVKNSCDVVVPRTLQIPENQTYELYAVVEHFGNLRNGHYTAEIKSPDDERWYNFNDATVTLLEPQPFQVDNFEKSDSAYLLFYRKNVQAADTCTQDISEVPTPGGFPPQEAVKIRERQKGEGAAEVGNDTVVAVSTDRNEETGKDRVRSRGVELPSDHCYNVEDPNNGDYAGQSIPYNHPEGLCYLQDVHIEKQRDEVNITVHMGGKAEADDRAKKKETLSRETQLEESVKDHDSHSGRQDYVRQSRPEEGLEGDNIRKASFNDQKCKQEVRKMGGVNQLEKRGKLSTKYLDRDVEHQDSEEIGQNFGLQPVDDKDAQRKVTLDRQQHCGQDEEDQNKTGLDDSRQNRSEQNFSFTHTGYKDVGIERQTKKQENTRDERFQNRADSSFRRAGSAGSRMNQGVGSVEERRQRDIQPNARLDFSEDSMDRRQEKTYFIKITEEEMKETPSGTQRSTETKCIEIGEGTSRDSIKSWLENDKGNGKRKSDHKIDASLSKGVCNLKLKESTLPEPQKQRTKGVIRNAQEENETNSTIKSSARKMHKESAVRLALYRKHDQKKSAKTKHGKKRGWWRFFRKNKTGCFSFFLNKRKNAN